MKVAFYTLGCKVNQYETESMAEQFETAGFLVVPSDETADVYVINSCTVTSSGDQKTRQVLHKFRRKHPDSIIAVTGCVPQAAQEGIETVLAEADVITGSSNRRQVIEAVLQAFETGERVIEVQPHEKGEIFEPLSIQRAGDRTRAFLKIQDGCERYCAYCIIPKARGKLRSKPLADVVVEAQNLADAGYKEIVLVGINLSCYGIEIKATLADAVDEIAKINGIERIRLGSLEPELLTAQVLKRFSSQPKFCPQFHLSLQSGSDKTLKRMNRHYTSKEYLNIVKNIRALFLNSSITTDIMVGFPGETEEEFLESQEFVRTVKFAKVHVFSYSRRPDTVADRMPNQISKAEKQERNKKMQQTAKDVRAEFLKSQIDCIENVLFEKVDQSGYNTGYSKNYTPIYVFSNEPLSGKIYPVKIKEISAQLDGCIGVFE